MTDEPRACTGECGRELPPSAFAKDARLKSGHRAVCKTCDRAATTKRRRGDNPKPGALVLVPKFPAPPAVEAAPRAEAPSDSDVTRRRVPSSHAEAAEAFIAALVPPAEPTDALHVRALRRLAELLDLAELGAGEWVVRDTTALVAKSVAVQRELTARRAAAKGAAVPAKPRASSY